MAESGQDEPKKKKGLQLPVSRRAFLRAIAVGAGVAALEPLTRKPGWMNVIGAMVRAEPVGANEPKREESSPSFEEKFFHNLTLEEKKAADEKVEKMKGNFDDHEGRCKRIAQYEDLITSSTEKYGIPKELLIGLIFAESGGDRMAVSEDAEAKGITQVMDVMAESWSKDGIFNYTNDENDDRYNVPKVLDYSCRELSGYFEKFGDWGLAFWAWHTGEPTVFEAVRVYFGEKGIDLPDINVPVEGETPEAEEEAYKKAMEVRRRYKNAIEGSGVCIHHLLTDEGVKNLFKKGDWNRTDEYCYRIVAGVEIYFSRQ